MRPPALFLAAVALLAASCGTNGTTARRVIASPVPSEAAEALEEAPTPVPTPQPRSAARVGSPQRTGPEPTSRLADANVRVVQVATLNAPRAMAVRSGAPGELYIAEKGGRVRVLVDGHVRASPALDISDEVATGYEQGLLGLAFSPTGSLAYVNFTDGSGDTVIREYRVTAGTFDEASARDVLIVDQPQANHNGGNLVFGPDEMLWIGLGDGGGAGDPNDNAQNLETLLGKMLRIDPRPTALDPYRIPSDNPFVGGPGRDEIWAYGLRNPWRYSFDRGTGDLFIGDAGQSSWEEVDWEPADYPGGANYGWNRLEGTHPFKGTPPDGHRPPIYEYSAREGGNCAVTGGYVYRGTSIPDLRGAYVFADFCAGRLRAFVPEGAKALEHRFLGPTVSQASSFGEDADGELYVLSLDGGVYRIEQA